VRAALAASSNDTLRVAQFSVESNHLHLLVEADGTRALTHGMRGLTIRIAKAVNRVLGRRGRVWGDRFHARPLTTRERSDMRSFMF
jgi:REP element-mobilizing transposase RayT